MNSGTKNWWATAVVSLRQAVLFSGKDESARMPIASTAQPAAPKRTVQPGSALSIISSDVVVNGTLSSTGEILIDGRVDGDVRCVSLVVGESGQIRGQVIAGDVVIRGHVKSRIYAHRVHLGVSSRVEGDILYAFFAVEAGAFVEGACQHADNPLAEASKKIAETKPAALPVMAAAVAEQLRAPMHHEHGVGDIAPTPAGVETDLDSIRVGVKGVRRNFLSRLDRPSLLWQSKVERR